MKINFFKSYRFKIIASFLTIIGLNFLIFLGYNWFINQNKGLQEITSKVYSLQSNVSNNNKYFQAFLINGYKSTSFHASKHEENIDTYIQNIQYQKQTLNQIFDRFENQNINIDDRFKTGLLRNFDIFSTLVNSYKDQSLKLGHRDFGLIGNMRQVAHQIEDSKSIPEVKILQLRRHEKDFLLRTDSIYIKKFNYLATELISSEKSASVIFSLNEYKDIFNQVTRIQFALGSQKDGLYGQITAISKAINQKLETLERLALNHIDSRTHSASKFLKISALIILLLVAIIIVYLSGILTRDLKRLQHAMHRFIQSGFKDNHNDIVEKSNIKEVEFLFKAYDLLKENLLKNIDGLEMTIEELERTTAYKSSFLANMSHEIRTPLNGIIGVINLIKQSNLNKKQLELLDIAEYSSSHLLGLINLILDYSKISAGKMELEETVMDVNSDLGKLVEIFKFQSAEKGIELYYDFQKNSESSNVVGDPVRLNQIIINLLNNAIKFTKKGWVKLTVRQQEIDKDYDLFYFAVEDTGIGIDKNKSDKIFQAFEQVDLSTTRKYGGTGLGLTISYELASLMGGELQFQSTKTGGTCFFFTVRLKKDTNNLLIGQAHQLMHNLPKMGGPRKVLVVDDNEMNRKVLGLMLKKFNLDIAYANNGLEAVSLADREGYDMIFMDIQMPLMDGLEATQKIKATDKFRKRSYPIIAVSASAYTDDRKKASDCGIDDFISKPIEIKKLQDLLIKYSLNAIKSAS